MMELAAELGVQIVVQTVGIRIVMMTDPLAFDATKTLDLSHLLLRRPALVRDQ